MKSTTSTNASKAKKRVLQVAGVVAALCILNIFCTWYYNPTAYDHDENRATDTIREAGAFTSRATEGSAWAVIDENGYNNTESQMSTDNIAVLMMGSSHTEALNVAQDESASYLLNDMLLDELGGNTYNIGISAHRFARNAANFERALDTFQPTDYVIVEAADIVLSEKELKRALNDSFSRQKATEIPVLPEWAYNQPLAKTIYNQLQSLIDATSADGAASSEAVSVPEGYQDDLTTLITQMRETADNHGVQLIIYYHPHLVLQDDGTAITDEPEYAIVAFKGACDAAGVPFIDMGDAFLEEYYNSYTLPHGFSNTPAGSGHLNADGHRMIANTLYEIIMNMEGADAEADSEVVGA